MIYKPTYSNSRTLPLFLARMIYHSICVNVFGTVARWGPFRFLSKTKTSWKGSRRINLSIPVLQGWNENVWVSTHDKNWRDDSTRRSLHIGVIINNNKFMHAWKYYTPTFTASRFANWGCLRWYTGCLRKSTNGAGDLIKSGRIRLS